MAEAPDLTEAVIVPVNDNGKMDTTSLAEKYRSFLVAGRMADEDAFNLVETLQGRGLVGNTNSTVYSIS